MEVRNALLASLVLNCAGATLVATAGGASVPTVIGAMSVSVGIALAAMAMLLWHWQRSARVLEHAALAADADYGDETGPTALAG